MTEKEKKYFKREFTEDKEKARIEKEKEEKRKEEKYGAKVCMGTLSKIHRLTPD